MTLSVCLIQTDLNMQLDCESFDRSAEVWLGSARRLERLWPSPSRKLTQALHANLRDPSSKTASANLPTLCHLLMGIMGLKKKKIYLKIIT